MKSKSAVALLCVVAPLASVNAKFSHGDLLLGWEHGNPGESLYSVSTTPSPTATLIGPAGGQSGVIAEIEYGNGVLYGADAGNDRDLKMINPSTGAITSSLTLSYPVDGTAVTSMEFVGGTLYAGLTTEGDKTADTFLSTINLNTGNISTIGATNVGSPLGGLAFQTSTNTMFAISAGGSNATLFTIDLGTGHAALVGEVTGVADFKATALEFGPDGVLYSLASFRSSDVGKLISIDPSTAIATDLGSYGGGGGLVALTTVPEPSAFLYGGLIAGVVGCGVWTKRRFVGR